MKNVKVWAVIVKNILLHVFIMYHGLKNSLWRSVYFFLFLAVSFYFLHPCGAIFLHPDTILRKRGAHQLLKCLVVVKARTPRLKQSCLHSCHLVGDFIISASLTLSLVYLLPSGKAPNTCINLGPSSWPYLFTTLLCPLAVHLNSQTV